MLFYTWVGNSKKKEIYFGQNLIGVKQKKRQPVSFYARVERLELPTPGFGDQCSTN